MPASGHFSAAKRACENTGKCVGKLLVCIVGPLHVLDSSQ